MFKEAQARIKINKMLEEAGWRFLDDATGKSNISLEHQAKFSKKILDDYGNDFEKTGNGYIDFLLLDDHGFPLVILEAKSEQKNPLDGKEQARNYAKSQNARFIILSNGNLHYFWDLEAGNPIPISVFPTQASLVHFNQWKPNPQALVNIKVEEDYIALTQYPAYQRDPRWQSETERPALVAEMKLKFLRKYQIKAIQAIQEAVRNKQNRFLFEMATGTGKTLTAAAIIKLFLASGNARRALFLVDRIELEDQAAKAFNHYLKNDYTTFIFKENSKGWNKAEIIVSTVQTLASNDKYKRFSPMDFDLVISDEAHRSISGNSRAVFEYFTGYKLGLTATPKDYLRNTTEEEQESIKDWERRQLLDTYKTFGCETGEPTFRYSLTDGVKDGFLINPFVIDARTEITTKLLSDEGYEFNIGESYSEDDDEKPISLQKKNFIHKDFERKFFSDETNRTFCETFLKSALRDPISGEIGKGIIFCVSQNHASKITQILNEMAMQLFPSKYQSDFAVQVTSTIMDAQSHTKNFSNNTLLGKSKWLEGYETSRARICVTVGMMTTGYDCEDILNLALMRPIFSPTDFVQIKGRGTRGTIFKFEIKEKGFTDTKEEQKESFKLFDFFGNCEYFEEKFEYDQVLKLPKILKAAEISTTLPPINIDKTGNAFNYSLDPIHSLQEEKIGFEGMRIDRELFKEFGNQIKANEFVSNEYHKGNISNAEEYIKEQLFNKPTEYFTLEKLRKSLRADRRVSLKEILDYVFIDEEIKSEDDLLENEFQKFISIYPLETEEAAAQAPLIKNFFKAYITDSTIREIVEQKEFSRFATMPQLTLEDWKNLGKWRDIVPNYIKDNVPLNRFM